MSFITFENVEREYHVGGHTIKAIDGISFGIEKGTVNVVLGQSGAGKTTVLNILGGMDVCDSGRVIVDGRDVSGLRQKQLAGYRRHDIGFVFQFYNLVQNLTVRENVELSTQICDHPLDPAEVLISVGLGDRIHNFPAQLSGGEQQRVAIARALAKRPKLLLCDEPTGALDYSTGKNILRLLHEMCHENGMTVVLITHNLAIAPMANRVIKMRSGKVSDIAINESPVSVDSIEW